MAKLLKLAKKGKYTTGFNPMVACFIVLDDKIIARGYHKKAGKAHAEQIAIKKIKSKNLSTEEIARLVLYVSLEPCNHIGKTESCADLIIQSGIKKVVIATTDPNPKMMGKSIQYLKDNGIECIEGVLKEKAQKLNASHFKRYQKNLPWVHLKIACNLKGQMNGSTSERVLISHKKSRNNAQKIRAKVGAIITSVNTVLMDNPSMVVHHTKISNLKHFNQPIRVILDSQLRVLQSPIKLNILNDEQSKVIIYHHVQDFDANKITTHFKNWVDFRFVEKNKYGGLALILLLKDLIIQNEINQVMVEAGEKLSTSFIKEKLVDQITLYLAKKEISSSTSILKVIAGYLVDFKIKKSRKIKNDIKLVYLATK